VAPIQSRGQPAGQRRSRHNACGTAWEHRVFTRRDRLDRHRPYNRFSRCLSGIRSLLQLAGPSRLPYYCLKLKEVWEQGKASIGALFVGTTTINAPSPDRR
jgi:hypothetical protein